MTGTRKNTLHSFRLILKPPPSQPPGPPQPNTRLAAKPAIEPSTKSISKPATEPSTKPASKPTNEPITKPTNKPMASPPLPVT
uniref:Pollen coat oleosin-glycine rich protein n=1 Tax=Tanacetum cinerariifolium TaxID=118510 RepID=A0A699T5Z6_TANCI|nr:pollen coat oleosin-glycine rich protein [Tanacetum cinerariifolium]